MTQQPLPSTGGSYVRDPKTGKLKQKEKPTRPPEVTSRKPGPDRVPDQKETDQ